MYKIDYLKMCYQTEHKFQKNGAFYFSENEWPNLISFILWNIDNYRVAKGKVGAAYLRTELIQAV